MGNNLAVLKKLTTILSADPLQCEIESVCIEENQAGFLQGLYNHTGEASVALGVFHAGSHIKVHEHSQKEYYIIFMGQMELFVDGSKHILRRADSYYVKPNAKHAAYFPIDTRMLCVTVPNSKEYPNDY